MDRFKVEIPSEQGMRVETFMSKVTALRFASDEGGKAFQMSVATGRWSELK